MPLGGIVIQVKERTRAVEAALAALVECQCINTIYFLTMSQSMQQLHFALEKRSPTGQSYITCGCSYQNKVTQIMSAHICNFIPGTDHSKQ